ncbi:hypothetical protein IAU60_002977 [Kwoniella sp. DSM 27419]
MQAPQLRLNERQANPNPYIIFIRSLRRKKDYTDAEEILKAIAAQMKTIMRDRFMQVHTLEEAEFNRVFAGRNWNHGQSIELVLRGPSGRFLPMKYITSVMCHEMAHIEQMNHGPKFQKLMADIKADVARLQARGYYGDGFWSDGKRLADSVRMGGEGLRESDFPEYVCGVSAADARKAKRPAGGPRASQAPGLVKGEASHRSGRQTDYRRKDGRRNNADMGSAGARLDGGRQITKDDREQRKVFVNDQTQLLMRTGMSMTKAKRVAGERWEMANPWWKEGSTRGKVAKSKTAAEMRAAAAEARLRGMSTPGSGPSTPTDVKPLTSMSDEDYNTSDEEDVKPVFDAADEVEDPHIRAEERKKEMEDEMDDEEREGLRGGWKEYVSNRSGLESTRHGTGTTGNAGQEAQSTAKLKRERSPQRADPPRKAIRTDRDSPQPAPSFGADMIRQERLRALGLAAGSTRAIRWQPGGSHINQDEGEGEVKPSAEVMRGSVTSEWACKVCTFLNHADHGRCDMCQARPDGSMPSDVII